MKRLYLTKILPVIIFTLVSSLGTVFAHPPTDLKLEYNLDSQTLHVEMKHVVGNTNDADHIRKIEIYKNQEDPITKYIVKQTTPAIEVDDIALTAKPGDVIRVVAFSSRGGSTEATLTVPEPAP